MRKNVRIMLEATKAMDLTVIQITAALSAIASRIGLSKEGPSLSYTLRDNCTSTQKG
jgi:hypothetical protein